ncbi:hypothetical protein [Pedobacter helvus]|uniref:Uncharacterized protein n=1 Tax=Pedobacter helvus TaxID=2563444 RepID=A0ABW9JMR3_9SPHI|nr:hypothetical protein [Pedobacter ureilyticus]
MKFTLSLLFYLLGFSLCFSQERNVTIREALSRSALQNRPLLLLVDTKVTDLLAKMNTLDNSDGNIFFKKINDLFTLYEGNSNDPYIKKILKTYYINAPRLIFMHPDEEVFYVDCGCHQTKEAFESALNKAIAFSNKKVEMSLKNQYSKNYSKEKLEKLINLRIAAGLIDNSSLIELYPNYIKNVDSLDYNTVKFILRAGPVIMGKAHQLIKDLPLINEVYKKEGSSFGAFVNIAIIENTLNKGINTICLPDAVNAARYYKSIHRNDPVNGQKYHDLQLITYYLKTGDTANYFSNASIYYDKHFMYAKLTDSIRFLEAKRLKTKHQKIEKVNSIASPYLNRDYADIIHSVTANYYSNELNDAARNFVKLSTTSNLHLTKALAWSKRAIELKPSSQNFETYALILYKLNLKDKAIVAQNKAIEIARELNNPLQNYLAQLDLIRQSRL